jgi:hypothetical protein
MPSKSQMLFASEQPSRQHRSPIVPHATQVSRPQPKPSLHWKESQQGWPSSPHATHVPPLHVPCVQLLPAQHASPNMPHGGAHVPD